MTDRELWERGVAVVTAACAGLSADQRERLAELSGAIRQRKAELHRLVDAVGGEAVCAACGGACCKAGKYHLTVGDLLIHGEAGQEPAQPRYGRGSCPHLAEDGCQMAPPFRPLTCIIFICDAIEATLASADLARCRVLEAELRSLCRDLEQLLEPRLRGPLLSVAERLCAAC